MDLEIRKIIYEEMNSIFDYVNKNIPHEYDEKFIKFIDMYTSLQMRIYLDKLGAKK